MVIKNNSLNINDFVHLNIHSEYSIYDGLIKIDNLIKLASYLGYNSLAITDISNLFGVIEFYEKCCINEIKPIIGSDFYLLLNFNNNNFFSRITILSKSNRGYKNLILLISESYKLKNKFKYPFININLLKKYNKGLIILSNLINGCLSKFILKNDLDSIKNIIKFYKNFFKNRFYIKISRIKKKNEEFYINNVINISKYYELPIVATNEVRFLNKKDFYYHAIKVSINNNKSIDYNLKLFTKNQFFKNKNEMNILFSDIPESIINSIEISKRCNVFIKLNKKFLPKFIYNEKYNKKILLNKIYEGLKNKILNKKINLTNNKYNIYINRLKTELKIIEKMNFIGYFLIVMEFINWAKKNNIPVGPGRGSGAGSLVSYLLNITNIDPILFDLIFERFLNPERISMPDLDIDFCFEKREKVIQHVIKLYKKDYVSKIITFNSLTSKSAIKDVGRVLGYPYSLMDKISKLIPINVKSSIYELINKKQYIFNIYKNNKDIRKIINISIKLEGYIKNIGKHAGGLVISPYKINNFTPSYIDENNDILTQLDKNSIEKIGLVKFDFLGLKTLTIMNNIIEKINNEYLKNKDKININNIPLNDELSFKLLKSSKTCGIFQLESLGIKKLMKELNPNSFEDIINTIALFRPGPLKSGMVKNFINRKNKKEKVFYPSEKCQHKLLIDILKPTYGIILYQEQIIKIAQVLSKYSLSEADILRQVISKKDFVEMKKQKEKFINGAINNNINKKLSNKIFNIIQNFSGYGFNKSHSVSYALISYQMLWLKSNFTIVFMSEVMTSYINNDYKINNLIKECKYFGIKILKMNINSSLYNFKIINNKIELGLGLIKGISKNTIDEIVKDRKINGPYNNIFDLCIRISRDKLNKKSIELLIKSGSCDSISTNSKEELLKLDTYIKKSKQIISNKINNQIEMFEY